MARRRLRFLSLQPNWRWSDRCRRRNMRRTAHATIGSSNPRRGSISIESRTTQPAESSSRVRSCHQTRYHQVDDDSRKPLRSGSATNSILWRSTGMTPSNSCQQTGVPSRHSSESNGAPPVGSVIRTNGATSRLMPATVDIAVHTSERLVRTVTSVVSRIAPVLPRTRSPQLWRAPRSSCRTRWNHPNEGFSFLDSFRSLNESLGGVHDRVGRPFGSFGCRMVRVRARVSPIASVRTSQVLSVGTGGRWSAAGAGRRSMPDPARRYEPDRQTRSAIARRRSSSSCGRDRFRSVAS